MKKEERGVKMNELVMEMKKEENQVRQMDGGNGSEQGKKECDKKEEEKKNERRLFSSLFFSAGSEGSGSRFFSFVH
jgi:hypothetical protein